MKKQLIALAALALVSTPALATKARMLSLGENINDNIGSLYFADSRNIFQNAAYANEYKDMIIMEWGASGVTGAAPATIKGDTDQAPQAEGGFLKSHGNYTYGLYLGAESPYTNEIRSYSRLYANQNFHQDNQIDLFFAGEAAFKWGVNLTYSTSENEAAGAKQDSLSLRLGMIQEKLEAFVNVALKNEAEINALGAAGKDKFEGKLGLEAGVTYDLDVVKVFAYGRHAKWEHEGVSVAPSATAYVGNFDGSYNLYQAGLGREYRLNDNATLFGKLEYMTFNRNVKATSGAINGAKVDLDDYRVPLTLGLEYNALSWLILRGSVVQNIVSEIDNNYRGNETSIAAGVRQRRVPGKRTAANSTNVNAGATVTFGNFNIDGVIGTDGVNNSTTSENGALTLDNLASRVAMTYRF